MYTSWNYYQRILAVKMRSLKKVIYLFVILNLFFNISIFAKKNSNIYKSSVSNIDLIFTNGATESEKRSAVRKAIQGSAKWVDAFLNQSDNKLQGSFNFDKKVNLIGIGFSTSSADARKVADRRCLSAIKEEGINQVGIYPKYVKINTRNGYVIYAILRTPVIGGFKNSDFSSNDDEVEDLFK